MQLSAVLVDCKGVRSSGLLFGNHWVLTHGTVLGEVQHVTVKTTSSQLSKPGVELTDLTVYMSESDGASCGPARLAWTWSCPLVGRAIRTLLPDVADIGRLSQFLILNVSGNGDVGGALADLFQQVVPPQRGERIMVEATPFGAQHFLNSWSEGIVSSVGGPNNCLLLVDARSTPCCEGAPIFTKCSNRTQLVGLVVNTLCSSQNASVGFTLGAALRPMLQRLDVLRRVPSVGPKATILAKSLAPAVVDDAVVRVRCGGQWGTGVVLDGPGHAVVVTCSHVVRTAPTSHITVCWRDKEVPASLVYKTDSDNALDVAVLDVGASRGLEKMRMASNPPVVGESVLAAGFPLISKSGKPPELPVIAHGIVALTSPFVMHTTCCVCSGMSGGAIMRPSGELLGIIVCNARDMTTQVVYPQVNMCIPISLVCVPLSHYLKNRDPEALLPFNNRNSELQCMWNLRYCPFNKL